MYAVHVAIALYLIVLLGSTLVVSQGRRTSDALLVRAGSVVWVLAGLGLLCAFVFGAADFLNDRIESPAAVSVVPQQTVYGQQEDGSA